MTNISQREEEPTRFLGVTLSPQLPSPPLLRHLTAMQHQLSSLGNIFSDTTITQTECEESSARANFLQALLGHVHWDFWLCPSAVWPLVTGRFHPHTYRAELRRLSLCCTKLHGEYQRKGAACSRVRLFSSALGAKAFVPESNPERCCDLLL